MKRLFFFTVALFLFLISCQRNVPVESVEVTRFLMDTVVRIAVYDASLPKDYVQKSINKAFDAIEEIEKTCSSHIPESEVSQINQAAGQDMLGISDYTLKLLRTALEVGEQTDGAFDVTVGKIKDHWGFTKENPKIPTDSELTELLKLVDFRQLVVEDSRAMLAKTGMKIDLGGIAKGLTIDEAVRVLQESGIRAGLVDAGGDMRMFGKHPQNPAWRIGIRHPRPGQKSMLGVLSTQANSVATSGDYERYFERDGDRYHHILDPETGKPANKCVSVTILTESAMLADAYATAVFVLGPQKGGDFIETLDNVEGLIVWEENGVLNKRLSDKFEANIRFLD